MSNVKRLNHAVLYVSDLDRSVEFYEATVRRYDPWGYERIMSEPRVGEWAMAPLAYRVHGPLRPSDAASLPGGDVLVLERSFSPEDGVRLRLRRLPRLHPFELVEGDEAVSVLVEAGARVARKMEIGHRNPRSDVLVEHFLEMEAGFHHAFHDLASLFVGRLRGEERQGKRQRRTHHGENLVPGPAGNQARL